MKKEAIRLGFILFAISFCMTAILAVLNEATKDTIAKRADEDKQTAMQAVMTSADAFELITFETPVENVTEVYAAKKDGAVIGYAVLTEPQGFGGPIKMMIGVSLTKEVKGIKIISLSETPGLGTKIDDQKYLGQFFGKTGEVKVSKDGGEIAAISGATISSRASTKGVNAAISAVSSLKQ